MADDRFDDAVRPSAEEEPLPPGPGTPSGDGPAPDDVDSPAAVPDRRPGAVPTRVPLRRGRWHRGLRPRTAAARTPVPAAVGAEVAGGEPDAAPAVDGTAEGPADPIELDDVTEPLRTLGRAADPFDPPWYDPDALTVPWLLPAPSALDGPGHDPLRPAMVTLTAVRRPAPDPAPSAPPAPPAPPAPGAETPAPTPTDLLGPPVAARPVAVAPSPQPGAPAPTAFAAPPPAAPAAPAPVAPAPPAVAAPAAPAPHGLAGPAVPAPPDPAAPIDPAPAPVDGAPRAPGAATGVPAVATAGPAAPTSPARPDAPVAPADEPGPDRPSTTAPNTTTPNTTTRDTTTRDTTTRDTTTRDTTTRDTTIRDASAAGTVTPEAAAPPASTTAAAGTAAPVRAAPATPAARPASAPEPTRAPNPDWAATSLLLARLRSRLEPWWPRRRPWTARRFLRVLTVTATVLVLVATGLAWGATSWVQAAIRDIGALDPNSSAIQDPAQQVGDQNYVIVGSDTRVGAAPSEDVGNAADVAGARSDTVMVVHVPADRSRVTVVSFPRDLEIDRPACERWDSVSGAYTGQFVPPAPEVKLNSAYAAGGPRCVVKTVQELSGLAVNHFLAVDFGGFKDMVDAVGGVPICTERPIQDSVLGTVVDHPGVSVLTGDQALGFVRARHVQGDPTSDYGRIHRQQRFLSALLRKVLSAGTLLDVGKLRGLVAAVSASTFGENLGADQLVGLGKSLGSVDPRDVAFVTVPTTGTANERGNEVARAGDDRALFSSIIDDAPLPGQAPAPGAAPPPAPVTPDRVAVRVVDGRSDDGSGSSTGDGGDPVGPSAVRSVLRGYGFGVLPADGTRVPGAGTTIRFSPDQAPAAAVLARAVPGARMTPDPVAGTLVLTVGDDPVRVTDPTAAATPVVPAISAADTACS